MKADKDGNYTWHPMLDEMDKQGISIMKFRSSRGKPRIELVEYVNKWRRNCLCPSLLISRFSYFRYFNCRDLENQSVCVDPVTVKGPNKDKTEQFLNREQDKTLSFGNLKTNEEPNAKL